jgi:hypothetical protein
MTFFILILQIAIIIQNYDIESNTKNTPFPKYNENNVFY